MNNLNFWLESFDKLRVERNPFKAHIIAESLNEHEQNQYAVLQAAFVLANGAINQDQERLYGFWLAAINNNLSLSNVITQAQAVDLDALRDGINLLEEKGLIEHFLIDVLVFTRLSGALSDNLKTILGEWCQLLSLSEAQLNDVIALTDHILGVEEPHVVSMTETVRTLLLNDVWAEFFTTKLTKSQLESKITQGIWLIESDIEIELAVEFENSIINFSNNAKLDIKNASINLNNTGLVKPIFNIEASNVNFDNVMVLGDFNADDKVTAFTLCHCNEFNVANSSFELKNARCFKFKDEESKGLFEATTFKNCGNEYLNGGVASYNRGVKFNSCEFTECIANIGGAIYAFSMLENTLIKCKIDDCYSFNENKKECGLYSETFYSGAVKSSDIATKIVIYNICGDNLLNNTKFSGDIEFESNEVSFGFRHIYSALFDTETIKKSGIDSVCNFMKKVSNIRRWSND
ncbi:hypothetical protein [Photobacterium carnosum]|uniref:Uncharacterized protein n=1 Tax=Photobacterium carnosum TaxID=2023717 RepID=A0A2N4UVR4_9GAMM|nr:hypothetical protein [Photobacterium carnosum]PLC59111.1 hypothetical protein CIK00_04790 [Photobacterium carnosum]